MTDSESPEAAPVQPIPEVLTGAFTCPACGHQSADIRGGDAARQGVPPAKDIVKCGECGTRIAYGIVLPRVIVTPHPDDPRFVQIIFQDRRKDAKIGEASITVDRGYGAAIATNLASICRP